VVSACVYAWRRLVEARATRRIRCRVYQRSLLVHEAVVAIDELVEIGFRLFERLERYHYAHSLELYVITCF
jgi:hypothetical protein